MYDAMEGEEKGEVFDTKVQYFEEEDRKQFAREVRGGLMYDVEGSLYDTGGKLAIFVLSSEGVLYASTRAKVGIFHHSSFLAGKPVVAAGELLVEQGKLVRMTDRSGHYRPDEGMTSRGICWLAAHGIDLTTVTYAPHQGDPPVSASDYVDYASGPQP